MSCHRPLNDHFEFCQKLIFQKNFEDFQLAHKIQEYFQILNRHTSLYVSNKLFLMLNTVLCNIKITVEIQVRMHKY